jgi:hypothetical protein
MIHVGEDVVGCSLHRSALVSSSRLVDVSRAHLVLSFSFELCFEIENYPTL